MVNVMGLKLLKGNKKRKTINLAQIIGLPSQTFEYFRFQQLTPYSLRFNKVGCTITKQIIL